MSCSVLPLKREARDPPPIRRRVVMIRRRNGLCDCRTVARRDPVTGLSLLPHAPVATCKLTLEIFTSRPVAGNTERVFGRMPPAAGLSRQRARRQTVTDIRL